MSEGTSFFVIEIGDWPVFQNSQIISFLKDNSNIHVTALTSGRFNIEIITPGESNVYFTSQIVEFVEAKRMILVIQWKNSEIKVWINKQKLESQEKNSICKVISKYYSVENIPSVEVKNSQSSCREWMEWRKHMYSKTKLIPKKGRKIKPINEQIIELKKSLELLFELVNHLKMGKTKYILTTLPILRSLLFWPDKKGEFNPLLIRIAGFMELPLPIYALPTKEDNIPEIISKALLRVINNIPSPFKVLPTQKIIDFQEWLNSIALEHNGISYRVKDIIFEASNTISAVHFDDDIPKQIDLLRINKFFDTDLLTSFIINISSITIYLGEYLIKAVENK